jgi:hypothetical protein
VEDGGHPREREREWYQTLVVGTYQSERLQKMEKKLSTIPNAKLLWSLSTLRIAIMMFGVRANELMMPVSDKMIK